MDQVSIYHVNLMMTDKSFFVLCVMKFVVLKGNHSLI